MQLYEKYRPQSLSQFIGQPKLIKRLERLTARDGWDRDALWLEGPSGVGKTTLAWILARRVAHDLFIDELDGHKCGVEAVRELESTLMLSAGDRRRVVIVNESHSMTRQAVQAWLTLLERLPKHTLCIFTTTENLSDGLFGSFSSPFASRCKLFSLSNQGLAQLFAERAREIAKAQGVDGKAAPAYLRLVQECRNNMRQVLQKIDAGEMID